MAFDVQHSELAARVTAGIPIEYQERFAGLCARPVLETEELLAKLASYVETVRGVASWVVALDPELAAGIATTCEALLRAFPTGDEHAVVNALVLYFIEEEDDDEVTGVLGFDDDLQVANSVCRALDRPDLTMARR